MLKNYSTRDLFPGGFFYLSIAVLFVSFGAILLGHTIWDYDFWWHLATGRYIVETKSIPLTDPFSFTSQLPENSNLYPLRERFILTQYWLGQIILYLLYHSFGPAGIGVLRAALLLGSLFLIYRALKDRGVMPYLIYLSLFLGFSGLLRSLGERPVLFTIFFSVLCVVLLDGFERKRSGTFYILPLLMMLWSNVHGGFILGDVIILIYMGVEALRLLFRRSAYSIRERITFFLVSALALGASGINPNGFHAFAIAFSREYAPFYVGIQEYQSPFFLYKMKFARPDYGFLAALFLFPVIAVLRNRRFNPTHFILLAMLAAGAVSAGRYVVYYCLIASLILGSELDLWLKGHSDNIIVGHPRLNVVFSVLMVASSVLFLAGMWNFKALKIRESAWTVPSGAADFISENHIKGNIFNDMGSGGYLTWRLYPDVKTFIDTRSLNYTVMREYAWISNTTQSIYRPTLPPGKVPLWKRLLEHYGVKLVVFTPLDLYGNMLPFIPALLEEDKWVPVFGDLRSIIFVKNVPENATLIEKFRLKPEEVLNSIVVKAVLLAQNNTTNPLTMESLGDLFQKLGKTEDAIKAYEYALKRKPDNPDVREKLSKLIQQK